MERDFPRNTSVLVLADDGRDYGVSKELLRLPGYTVRTCSDYVEMLLYLEHETFQLVIIFESEKSGPICQGELRQAAESHAVANVIIFKRPEEVANRPKALTTKRARALAGN